MRNHVPQPNLQALRPEMVVAVRSLLPEFKLACLDPISGYPAGTLLPVYGGNVKENTLYTDGETSKERRIAADFEEFENEVIFKPLPDYIEELNPNDYRLKNGDPVFELVLTRCKIIHLPIPENTAPECCKVIEHPAVKFAPVPAKTRKIKPVDPAQFEFPFAENKPSNLKSA